MINNESAKKGGSDAAFFFLLILIAVVDVGKLFPVRLGILRLVVFSSGVLLLWRGRDEKSETELYPLIVGGFSLLSLGHAFSSIYPWVSMQHAVNITMASVIVWCAYRIVRNDPDRAREAVFLSICAVAVLQFVVALYQRHATGIFRPRGTFDNTNFFAEFMAIAGVLCLSRSFAKGERAGIRVASAAGALLFLAAALGISASRAVLIAVVPALGILLLWRFGWKRGGVLLLAGGIPALALLGFQAAERFASPDPYNYARLVMWKSAVRIFQSYPFGVGLGGYKYYWFATQSPVEGAFAKYGKYATTAHNEFLEVLTGLGAAGLVLLLLVLLIPLILALAWYPGYRGREKVGCGRGGRRSARVGHPRHVRFQFPRNRAGRARRDPPWRAPGVASPGPFTLPALRFSVVEAARCGGWLSCCSPSRRRPWRAKSLIGRESSRLRHGDIIGAESMFRFAIGVDPFCDTYPDAMASIGHRLFLEGVQSGNPDPLRAESLLTESIRWEAKAVSLSPRDFRKTSRLSRLFVDRYGVSRRQEDLEGSIDWAGRALEINPYSAEKLWDRAELLILDRRPADAVADLTRAVSIEPNFCRGYAKLAGLTKEKDELQSRAWEARAEKCREAAKGRTLEENERWLVEEPESSVEVGGGEERGRRARFAVWSSPRRADPPFRSDLPSGHDRSVRRRPGQEIPPPFSGRSADGPLFPSDFGTSSATSCGWRQCRSPATGI